MAVKFLKRFMMGIVLVLLLCVGITVLFDPFYQYHKPLPGLKAVLNDKEYQCVGSLKNFDYDSVIAGSSVTENYNNKWFDEGFDCTTIKAARSYGGTADLCYLLDIAFRKQELKYVFYNLDPSSLSAEPVTTYESTGCPMYLYDDNHFNDLQYWLNKDVLFEKIPYMLAQSFIGDYEEGNSYNWAQWKTFSEDMILSQYYRKNEVADMKSGFYSKELDGNLVLLKAQIENHPETVFKVFVPPYSLLWWDNIYRTGETEEYLYNLEKAMETLLVYENVEVYFFMNDREIVSDLNNYMDLLHFSDDVNKYICDSLIAGTHRVTTDNYKEIMADMKELAYYAADEFAARYEDRFLYE